MHFWVVFILHIKEEERSGERSGEKREEAEAKPGLEGKDREASGGHMLLSTLDAALCVRSWRAGRQAGCQKIREHHRLLVLLQALLATPYPQGIVNLH